jgi:hypothetical protein
VLTMWPNFAQLVAVYLHRLGEQLSSLEGLCA